MRVEEETYHTNQTQKVVLYSQWSCASRETRHLKDRGWNLHSLKQDVSKVKDRDPQIMSPKALQIAHLRVIHKEVYLRTILPDKPFKGFGI